MAGSPILGSMSSSGSTCGQAVTMISRAALIKRQPGASGSVAALCVFGFAIGLCCLHGGPRAAGIFPSLGPSAAGGVWVHWHWQGLRTGPPMRPRGRLSLLVVPPRPRPSAPATRPAVQSNKAPAVDTAWPGLKQASNCYPNVNHLRLSCRLCQLSALRDSLREAAPISRT